MPCLLLVGIRRNESGERLAECLYAGFDGTALNAAADAARKGEKKWDRFCKVAYPMSAPIPVDGTPIQQSTPKFPERKKAEPIKSGEKPEWMRKRDDEILAQRNKSRPATPQPPEPIKTANVIKADGSTGQAKVILNEMGPTIQEYIEAGYDPRRYPPKGFASKSTPEQIVTAITKWEGANPEKAKEQVEINYAAQGRKPPGNGEPVAVKVVENPPAANTPPAEETPQPPEPTAENSQTDSPEVKTEAASDDGQKNKTKKATIIKP